MSNNPKAAAAILAVFPTLETLHSFSRKNFNKKALESFIAFAANEGVIDKNDGDAFRQFIRINERDHGTCTPPKNLNLEEIFKRKKEFLKTNLSARTMTDRINLLILKYQIDLPKVSNTMLTRLKKEPADTSHKRNTLRSLAFWIGYERSELGPAWNFETFLKLCNEAKRNTDFKEGVRIGFTLSSRGDVIDLQVTGWLKNNLKDYIRNAIDLMPSGNWGKVKSHDITTSYIDFPKEEGVNNPISYQTCIRNAIAIAHQISIRWAMSEYCTKNRFLSIGIAAGDFKNLDNYLLPILNAKLPGDPVIRMTDYAHQYVLMNDIRAVFCETPKETILFNGEALNIWWIEGLWSYIYWDFIPAMLEDSIMQTNPSSLEVLNQLLFFPEQLEIEVQPNTITRFFAFPHNSMLGIEIAKTFFFRRRFFEANEILRMVLSIDPKSLNARTLRMVIFRSLASEAESSDMSEIHFKRAEKEAEYILENCRLLDEDFYCEYGVISLTKAIIMLKKMRTIKEAHFNKSDVEKSKNTIFERLEMATDIFEKAMMVSATGYRSVYLLFSTQVLARLLKRNVMFFTRADLPIHLSDNTIREFGRDILVSLNFLRSELPEKEQRLFLEKILMKSFANHNDAVSLETYRPTIYFCFAVILWDVDPAPTVGTIKTVLQLLKDIISMAEKLAEQDLCIYAYTRCYGEMLRPSVFIGHIQKSIKMITDTLCDMGSLDNKDPDTSMTDELLNAPTLLTLNI
ncbi:MAG: hypothetical protein KJ737_21140 [Proteobacteria bacterium]|nr:hypothetical protein [Pseudomonadota bacterium]